MSASNASINFIAAINNASNALLAYVSVLIYIFGLIGNNLNLFVLSQRTLRSNPSAIFFIISSGAGILIIISGLTSRMMSGYSADLTLTVGWLCKIRNFILYSSRTVLLWMIVFATIDRWLSSNLKVNLRRLSNMKNVHRSIIIVLIYTFAINTPILYCYEANLSTALRACYGATYACRLTTDLIYAFATVEIPLLIMSIFSLLIIRNINRIENRIQNATHAGSIYGNQVSRRTMGQTPPKKINKQLLKMLLAQVALLFLFTSPHSIQKVYTSFTPSLPPQSLANAVQTLVFNIFTLLSFTASGMPFYIYTLAGGSLFRKAFLDLMKMTTQRFLRCSCC